MGVVCRQLVFVQMLKRKINLFIYTSLYSTNIQEFKLMLITLVAMTIEQRS